MDDFEQTSLTHEKQANLPLAHSFLTRLRPSEILDFYISADNLHIRLATATVSTLLVRDIVMSHEPHDTLLEWVSPTNRRCSTR